MEGEEVNNENTLNPLYKIFKISQDNKCTEEIESVKNISLFFKYLENDNIPCENKVSVINEFKEKLKINRYISEYFSFYEKKSIYIFLFDLYLSLNSNEELRLSILDLIKELIINIEISKKIYEYIFQKFSEIYRGEENESSSDLFYYYLTLLNSIVSETENIQKPRNYFACSGDGKFEIDLSREKIELGKNLTFIMNFKIGESTISKENPENLPTAKLLKIDFSNGKSFTLELKYPFYLIFKESKNDFKKAFPLNEWNNLIFSVVNYDTKLEFHFFLNGENKLSPLKLLNNFVKNDDYIDSISFFDNFYGEVTSMTMLMQKEDDTIRALRTNFLKGFRDYKDGLWKPKLIENFITFLKNVDISENEIQKTRTYTKIKEKTKEKAKENTINSKEKFAKNEKTTEDYSPDLVFIFSPINCSKYNNYTVESCLGKYNLNFNGNIRIHKYYSYQKKLELIGGISNFLPLAELFLTHNSTLTEENLLLFLKIIKNMLKQRKNNMRSAKECKMFKILSLFIEKFPNHLFTEKILNSFNEIGKTIFSNNFEALCSSYFKHILLNEKILSKYSETLQIKFWNQILLFCESDKDQIETFININRICLILRFYDRNKYKEMCCQEHLCQLNEEYVGNKTLMNPPMSIKLISLKNILNVVIVTQEFQKVMSLFKLLTLDLSPCLTKIILNIFTNAFINSDKKFKNKLITGLVDNHFETIIINTFIHSLPDIRFDIITFMNQVYNTLLETNKKHLFNTFIKMIKTCLLPQSMFYASKLESETYLNEKHKKFEELYQNNNKEEKKEENEISNSNLGTEQTNEIINEEQNKIDFETFFKQEQEKDKSNPNLNKQEVIIDKALYFYYKQHLFDIFFMWSLNQPIDITFQEIDLKQCKFENEEILEIVLSIIKEINENNLTLKFFDSVLNLLKFNNENGLILLQSKKLLTLFLDAVFRLYKKEKEDDITCYNLGKKIIYNIFITSFFYIEKHNQKKFLFNEIENIFLWDDQHLMRCKDEASIDNLYEFTNEILLGLLSEYKKVFEQKMNFNINSQNFDIGNFYLYNYFIMMTKLFRFAFHFKLNSKYENDFNLKKNIMERYTDSMRLNYLKIKIEEMWINYPIFEEIFNRINFIWGKKNTYKKYSFPKTKVNKVLKYEDILKKIILDKNEKNIYQKEITFLCYEEIDNETNIETIISLIRIVPICLMGIISMYSQTNNEAQFKYWLKEYKNFIRFVILASSNITRANQLDYYNKIQEKCICPILIYICYMKDLMNNCPLCKDKIKKNLQSIIILCFMITKYQYKYTIDHKKGIKFFKIVKNLARNDLISSAVFLIFSEVIKDKNGNSLLPLDKLEQLSLSQYVSSIDYLDKNEFNDSLYYNANIIKRMNETFFTFFTAKKIKENRYNNISFIIEELNDSYKKEILELLPLYEKELVKYSNNSLENNIKKKNIYKGIKKKSFSWGGFWSDRVLFFEHIDKLKLKLTNHYTKTMMKPLLVPILDISYYLPEFSGFDVKNLFNNNENSYKLTIDIDKIFKANEQNQIELNNIKENSDDKKNKIRENYFRKIYTKSNIELLEILTKISNNLDFGKEEEFTELENEQNTEQRKYFLTCLVKTSHHIKGVCFIGDNKLNFKIFLNQKTGNSMSGVEIGFTSKDDDYDQERQTCFGSYFVCHPKDKDLYKISIQYDEIKYIFRRRYYYKNSAIEIFTVNNKSFYFNFKYEEDREKVIKEIVNRINDYAKIVDDLKDEKDSFDNVIGYENNSVIHCTKKNNKKTKLSKKIESWREWEMSNFEILMWLNIYSNRSYSDISQYPVFPWTLSNYEDPLKVEQEKKHPKNKTYSGEALSMSSNNINLNDSDDEITDYCYRDMELPMGMMELNDDGKRKELFKETYETLISDDTQNEIKPYVYGSNYSNPMYVCNFLMRLFPFTHISIELQGKKFDTADRLFFSVKNSFYNSTTQKTDVRELIPEFFYLPEMFININDLNLGIREDGTKVNDVSTPCDNNPYDFVMTMKTVLENDIISYSIQNWIDLIFGYKAKGKEAEISFNLFTEASYQESIDIKKVEDKASYLRLVEFGLIPNQIISNKECPKRTKKVEKLKAKQITDPLAILINNTCKSELTENKKKEVKLLTFSTFDKTLFLFYSDGSCIEKKIALPFFDKTYNEEIINKIMIDKFYNQIGEFYSSDSTNNKTIKFIQKGKSIILGGFNDGKVLISSLDKKKKTIQLNPFNDESPILSIATDKEEEFLFMGNSIGNSIVYKKDLESNDWKIHSLLTDQSSPISHIYCSDDLNLWSSASIDGYIYLYTLPKCKLIRSIKVPTKNCSYVFLSDSPLPSIIVLSDEAENTEIFVYSINGKFRRKEQKYYKIINPILIKDLNSFDYLVYVGNENVNVISLPDLNVQRTIDHLNGIMYICPSEDNKILYALNKDGNEITFIKEETKKIRSGSMFLK